jgi:hypothetical protein
VIVKILVSSGVLLIVILFALLLLRTRDASRVERVWRRLEVRSQSNVFNTEMLSGLPGPARRYFLHAIKPGTPLASSVTLEMSGAMRLKPDAAWMPMHARQILSPPQGFVWKATAGSGLLRMSGADYYLDEASAMIFRIWGIIPVVRATGPDIARSAAGRMAGESFWIPSALLPGQGVKWEAVDESSARVTFEVGSEAVGITISVDRDGTCRSVSFRRWGDRTEDGSFAYIPFGGDLSEERTFGGYTIPTTISGGWWYGNERYFEFFRARVENADFM